MIESETLLNILQLSDSSLPVGRFAHSNGLESLLHYAHRIDKTDIMQYLETLILESVSTLDAVATVHAHRQWLVHNMNAVREIDSHLTSMKLSEGARYFSHSTGSKLINIGLLLTECDRLREYITFIEEDDTLGNAAIVMAILSSQFNIDERCAVLLVSRDAAITVLSAGVRLGVITATESQLFLKNIYPVLCRSYDIASDLNLDEMTESALEYDIYMSKHKEIETKSFLS